MKNLIPSFLVYGRLFISFSFPLLASFNSPTARITISVLVVIGFFADIFDGIIARWLGVSNEGLRKLDSIVDRIFWLITLFCCYQLNPTALLVWLPAIATLLLVEAMVYLLSLYRFGKIPSPHNLLTKLWGIFLAITLVEFILRGQSLLMPLMITLGFISRVDSLLIYLILKKWDHDIPSFYHAIQLSKGKAIKRRKLFNG